MVWMMIVGDWGILKYCKQVNEINYLTSQVRIVVFVPTKLSSDRELCVCVCLTERVS